MRKQISVIALASLFVAGSAMASGYRIPEQSLDSTAKAGANVASADKADVSYYNPAGMALLSDEWHIEGAATYLHLTSIEYDDARDPTGSLDGSTEKENFLLPTIHVVSPDYNNFRFGFSFVEPYGLAKRWLDPFPSASARKFDLKVFEMNPTVSYKFNDMLSIGGGVRAIYSEADVILAGTLTAEVDSVDWGYNLAVDFKPNDDWNFAVTYRSHVDLEFDGDVMLLPPTFPAAIPTTGDVNVPAPAVLTFSAAYTVDRWTFDLTVDQTQWSEYESLTLNTAAIGATVDETRNWDDTWAIRLGIEYQVNEKWTLMGGIAYDENPVPEEHLGFELPDSDAWLFSVGARYAVNDQLELGLGILYDYKEERSVNQGLNPLVNDINGEFSNASAFLVSAGVSYRF